MQFLHITFFALVSSCIAAADTGDIEVKDIPTQCVTACQPAIQLSASCEQQFNDNDAGYLNCVCTGQNAASIIPACDACVSTFNTTQSGRGRDKDDDVNELLRSCAFSTTTFVSATGSLSTTFPTFAPTRTGVSVTTTNAAGQTTVLAATAVQGATNTGAAVARHFDLSIAGVLALGAVGIMEFA